jgi:hypothetical protein
MTGTSLTDYQLLGGIVLVVLAAKYVVCQYVLNFLEVVVGPGPGPRQ